MDKKEAKKRILELSKQIEAHNYNYYEKDEPDIEDFEYDVLMCELKSLEETFPELIKDTSPTQNVGGNAKNTFEKVTHNVLMGSLQDVFSKEDLVDFDKKVRNIYDDFLYVVEPKIDGLSVSLEYENGELIRGSTRGDGQTGEDVTLNLKTIKNVPKTLKTTLELLEVRGEVFMPKSSFEKVIYEQEINEEKIFKNPRNAAAGSLRQKDPKIAAKRLLDIYVFNVQQIKGQALNSHIQSLDFLKEQGFNVSPSYKGCKTIEEAIAEIDRIGETRGEFSFDIDGAVIKIDDFKQRETLGYTSKFPKWAVAFKYPPEEKQTVITEIQLKVGRTGAITPTAVFEPVLLAGTTVSRAVLHNQDFINERNINIGDTVVVRKAGDIIPEVVKLVEKGENPKPYKLPENCPSCFEPASYFNDESALRCTNPTCEAQVLRTIIHFVSRDAMDIDGLGPSIIELLVNNNLVKSSADLYNLNHEQLSTLERLGEKSANNIINAINKSKENDLNRLINALGIRNIGVGAAKDLSARFKSIDNLMGATIEEISSIDGFGETMAQSVVDFFSHPGTKEIIGKLKLANVNMTTQKTTQGTTFLGQTFVLTGTLPTLTREKATIIIENLGGTVSSSVSKKTSFLLAGEAAGSKLTKALALDVKIINEEEFLKLSKHRLT